MGAARGRRRRRGDGGERRRGLRLALAGLAQLLSLTVVAGCGTRNVALVARVCGAMCGEDRTATDYTGMDCAIAARIRLLPAAGAARAPLVDRCLSLMPVGNSLPTYRLSDLFDNGAGSAHPLSLGQDPGVPFVVEIALYAPGSQPCMEDQPLVGLGRSGIVDLSRDTSDVTIPIGCRDACESHGNVQAQLLSLEDLTTPTDAPADLSLGEIFPYGVFTATAGVCMMPPLTAHRGQFRAFSMAHSGPNLDGVWVVDSSEFDGCTALAGTVNGVRQLACLSDAATSKATLVGYVVSAAHADAVRTFNHSVHAAAGALVFRLLDPADNDPNGSALGARVSYGLLSTLSEAEYPQDDTWAVTAGAPPGTTSASGGVAILSDAPSGPYIVTFSDGTSRIVNAGSDEDPDSVTVVVVNR